MTYSGRLGNVIGIVTRVWTRRSGVSFPGRARDFPLLQNVLDGLRVPSSHLLGEGRFFFFHWVNRPGPEVDYSNLLSADDKNDWSYASAPAVCLPGMERLSVFTLLRY
jgi:hypothetical protein